ncbi:MAG TPA: arabinofuranosidase catalytic domain-containing protein [bacterium]|nr:arabinofuranosidase catalytic domain-containing protein [bacterium]HPN42022.1 arabinofuranosidase catalytic domain-containing protein [bacterium]
MKKRISFVVLLAMAIILPAVTKMADAKIVATANAIPPRPAGPSDIYTTGGYPCVAAHSTTRALFASYNGPLYQVMRRSDGKTLDIGIVQPSEGDAGGYADAAAQDAFSANTVCWITKIYDQSGNGNHLVQAPPGTFKGPAKGGFNTLPIADMAPITISGQKVYGVYIIPGMGLRNNNASGLAVNDEPQSIYMVFDGTHFDSGCCFNYGNTSTNSRAVGRGTMETVYFGTATAWGSGSGSGPWIMSDMEAGLFSGYDSKQNVANPTIDTWRFVTGFVSGGGENRWQIRGGNAQAGELAIFYEGVRPGSLEDNNYYPMHRKGAVQMGNGGDNGNGSSGTFYEGVVTTGYPADAIIKAVQANIVAARYDVQLVNLTRVTTFTPGSTQDITETFTNTTGATVTGVTLSISVPAQWTALVSGSKNSSKTFVEPVKPGACVKVTFKITAPVTTGAGFLIGKVEWIDPATALKQSDTIISSIRNSYPVKINEVRFSTSANPTNQFIELYNSSGGDVDISGWSLVNTISEWAPVKLATIPAGTKIKAGGYYLLGLAASGLAVSAGPGETTINVFNSTGFVAGQQINIDGEIRAITSVGTAATAMTTVFVPVSTGPWLTIPAGSTNLPVTSAAGFEIGQKISIDIGGNNEVATVTSVGKAATQTSLTEAVDAGSKIIKVAVNSNMTIGDTLTVGTGKFAEHATIKNIINVVSAPGGRSGFEAPGEGGVLELMAPLKFDHLSGVDVSDVGTGINFLPATQFQHKSGDAVQALGSGITLDKALDKNHEYGAAVLNPQVTTAGYQGSVEPNLWYGGPLSIYAGSIALLDENNELVVDALVYGSQQSNSSANGTITSPEIAILEGNQSQGGCIVTAPSSGRRFNFYGSGNSVVGDLNLSVGRFPDGLDTDNNCIDFLVQSSTTLAVASAVGADNIKVAGVEGLDVNQEIVIDGGPNQETAVIATVGTAGGAIMKAATDVDATLVTVNSTAGFSVGQTITIDSGANYETAVIASINRGRMAFGEFKGYDATITVNTPLKFAHAMGVKISGSGITLATPLSRSHNSGVPIVNGVPTPGSLNRFYSNQ